MSISQWYRKFLRDMKKAGLKVEDMPLDVAQSALVIHQQALLEWRRRPKAKRAKEVDQTCPKN